MTRVAVKGTLPFVVELPNRTTRAAIEERESGQGKQYASVRIERAVQRGGVRAQRLRHPSLTGEFKGYRDCHVRNDLVLIYQLDSDVLKLARSGTLSVVLIAQPFEGSPWAGFLMAAISALRDAISLL